MNLRYFSPLTFVTCRWFRLTNKRLFFSVYGFKSHWFQVTNKWFFKKKSVYGFRIAVSDLRTNYYFFYLHGFKSSCIWLTSKQFFLASLVVLVVSHYFWLTNQQFFVFCLWIQELLVSTHEQTSVWFTGAMGVCPGRRGFSVNIAVIAFWLIIANLASLVITTTS